MAPGKWRQWWEAVNSAKISAEGELLSYHNRETNMVFEYRQISSKDLEKAFILWGLV